MSENRSRLLIYFATIIVTLLAIAITLYFAIYVVKVLPLKLATLLEIVTAILAGYLSISILSAEVKKATAKLIGAKGAQNVSVVFEYVGYIILALAVLGIAGISGTELLAGGTFAGLVLGLAAQTVLSNVLAGIMLLLARPMKIGDRVTITTSQYGLIVPSYPPKFFSDDRLIPGYTGIVTDIGLAYSLLTLDEGAMMKIPNNVLIQAAVIIQEVKERMVKVRFQAPASVPLDRLIESIREITKKNEWVVDPDSVNVFVQAIDPNYYLILVESLCKGQYEEPPRTSLFVDIWRVIRNMSEERVSN
jgi:small conductance mechanosensitive channel